jgi:FtsP/CotA-like multicopper oxidase with cupredoxin domain
MLNRRQWLQQSGTGLLGATLLSPAHAARPVEPQVQRGHPPVLRGQQFELHIDRARIEVGGRPHWATVVNGHLPGPTLRWREGDVVQIRVVNHLSEPTSIHWHGILLPSDMDGVPGLSFAGIPAGGEFVYQFPVQQSGTYWYHAHSGFQEQTGLLGGIIIDPAQPDPIQADAEHLLVLSDWAMAPPQALLNKLRTQADFDNIHPPTAGRFWRDIQQLGWQRAVALRQMWQQMRMSPTDFSDLSGRTSLRYLINGCETAAPCRIQAEAGQRLRLRLINGSAQTIFDVKIPGTALTVVAADGLPVQPVTVEEFRIGVAEVYDVLVDAGAVSRLLVAQSIDRSAQVQAVLAVPGGGIPPLPPLDPVQWLSMQDMMGDHHGAVRARHARSEYGWQTDMRVDHPRTRLDDPGVNLRHARQQGRRVLSYADLRPLRDEPEAQRSPDREIELHLTGNMARYVWGFDGLTYEQSSPIELVAGERVRFRLVNDTMMTHPMHLHGMWSDLRQPDGQWQVRKHTILVQPAQQVCFDVTAVEGRWAFHCHLLYHMSTGMFREVYVRAREGEAQHQSGGHHHAQH